MCKPWLDKHITLYSNSYLVFAYFVFKECYNITLSVYWNGEQCYNFSSEKHWMLFLNIRFWDFSFITLWANTSSNTIPFTSISCVQISSPLFIIIFAISVLLFCSHLNKQVQLHHKSSELLQAIHETVNFPGCLRGILICLVWYSPKYGNLDTIYIGNYYFVWYM